MISSVVLITLGILAKLLLKGEAMPKYVGCIFILIFFLGCSTTPPSTTEAIILSLPDQVMPNVMTLSAHDKEGNKTGQGSAFVWDQGYLVTNAHVVAGASWVEVYTEAGDSMGTAAYALHVDTERDLAVLPWPHDASDGLSLVANAPSRGDKVFAFGAPLGLEGTMSNGIVSALRSIDEVRYIQTTAPISPGSSGGPLVDEQGNIVGVVSAYMQDGQNLNLAISSSALDGLSINRNNRLAFPNVMSSHKDEKEDKGLMFITQLASAEVLRENTEHRGRLNAKSPTFLDKQVQFFRIDGHPSKSYSIEVISSDFTPLMTLFEFNSLLEEDVWGRESVVNSYYRSTLTFTPPRAGEYYLIVQSTDSRLGLYDISLSTKAVLLNNRWLLMGKSASDDRYYLDVRTVSTGYIRGAWVLTRYAKPKSLSSSNEFYDESTTRWEVRCTSQQLRINEVIHTYEGRRVSYSSDNSEWTRAAPNTVAEMIANAICEQKGAF